VTLLKPTVDRYADALGVASHLVVDAEVAAQIESVAEKAVADLPDCPAWPVLRSQLLLLAAAGVNPLGERP